MQLLNTPLCSFLVQKPFQSAWLFCLLRYGERKSDQWDSGTIDESIPTKHYDISLNTCLLIPICSAPKMHSNSFSWCIWTDKNDTAFKHAYNIPASAALCVIRTKKTVYIRKLSRCNDLINRKEQFFKNSWEQIFPTKMDSRDNFKA